MSPELVDLITQGERALAATDWDAARSSFEAALELEETAEALDGLGWVCFWQGDSGEELPTWQFAISAPIHQMLAGHSPEKRQAALLAVADAANRHADPDGRIRVAGLNVEISAQRPA